MHCTVSDRSRKLCDPFYVLLNKLVFSIQQNKTETGFLKRNPRQGARFKDNEFRCRGTSWVRRSHGSRPPDCRSDGRYRAPPSSALLLYQANSNLCRRQKLIAGPEKRPPSQSEKGAADQTHNNRGRIHNKQTGLYGQESLQIAIHARLQAAGQEMQAKHLQSA